MASFGVATAHENSYNIIQLKREISQYKGKVAQMKETLRNEEEEGRETKRKYDVTLSNLEGLQEAYQILDVERDALLLSNTIFGGENTYLESMISRMEA